MCARVEPPALPELQPPSDHSRPEPRVVAFMNQKGGVGKTTTVVNLGAALAGAGRRVLLIDLDPQAHLTLHLGIDSQHVQYTVYDLMTDAQSTVEQVLQCVNDQLWVLPAEMSMAGLEVELAPRMITGRAQRVLKEKCTRLFARHQGLCRDEGQRLAASSQRSVASRAAARQEELEQSRQTDPDRPPAQQLRQGKEVDPDPLSVHHEPFDYVFIDCPPSLGLLTVNALTLAREVIVPMQAQFLALQGLSKLFETVGLIHQSFNPRLAVSGIVVCMHEPQTILAGEVLADLTAFLEQARDQDVPWRSTQILRPPIRRNIKLAECPSFGRTIFDYAPQSHGAADYRRVAESIMAQERMGKPNSGRTQRRDA